MNRRPPRSSRTDTLFPYPTLFRSAVISAAGGRPRSLSSVAFTNTITRIGLLLRYRPAWPSCWTTKQGQWNRHGRGTFRNFFSVGWVERSETHHRHTWAQTGRWVSLRSTRSEEHTSELQSLMRISYAVFCLKKK